MLIVVVEDDRDARELLVMMLDPHEVVAACSVEEAIGTVERTRPAVVISDLRLGSDSGLRLAEEIAERGLQIPFLIISGLVERSSRPQGLVRGYLAKPFESAALHDAVHKTIAAGFPPS